jgi:AraC-like DNA-binding protein
VSFIAQGRMSDSPYIDSIWQGQSDEDLALMCPADGRLNIRITKLRGATQTSIEGPITRAIPKTHVDGVAWIVIKFRLGVYIPSMPARRLLDADATLSEASGKSFWLNGFAWEHFDFENADVFVHRLARRELLLHDLVVDSALRDEPLDISPRTIRHHFLHTTGITQSHIRQIERAREALTLLQQDVPILDVVHQLHYADQPHLTRALKRFMGHTPAQIPHFAPAS